MSTTSITLTRQTVEQMIPATFDKNKGFFSLVTVNWTEQMFYELPTITVELYIKNGTTDIKTPLFSRVIKTYNPNTKIKESWEHTKNVIDVPESCYLKLIPNFDNNAVSARNSLIENGIEEGELWEAPTTQFPIILSIGEEAGGTEQTIEGQPPISFISTTTSLIDWTLYGNSIQNGTPTPTSPKPVLGCGDYYETEPELKTLTGVPPFTINTDGTSIETWSIDGNSQQNGTPTPDNPVMPEFVGVRTAQLFDIDGKNAANGYVNNAQLNSDNSTETWGSAEISEYIPIVGGAVYSFNGIGSYNSPSYCFYDADKQYISGDNYRGRQTITFTAPSNAKYFRFTHIKSSTTAMCNAGDAVLPYEPYGWKIPITCAGQTTPVYLGEVPTVRKIRKLVLDGTENISYNARNDTIGRWAVTIPTANGTTTPENVICTHFVTVNSTTKPLAEGGICMRSTGVDIVVGGLYTDIGITAPSDSATIVNAVKAFLAAQYASGNPVTVWYVMSEPETAIVNEPLAKIGTYADTLTSEQAGIILPTIKGTTTVTVDTNLLPSNMSITYYEQFQKYIIPITNRSNTQTIDLSAVQSNRKIRKLVLTGEETFGYANLCFTYTFDGKPTSVQPAKVVIFSNAYEGVEPMYRDQLRNYQCCITRNFNQLAIRDDNYTDAVDFKAYLAAQYAADTPVTIWYVLVTEETGIVNEPLMKIGTYSDSITKDQSGITIPVEKGLNTIEVETEVPPSNMEIIYQ